MVINPLTRGRQCFKNEYGYEIFSLLEDIVMNMVMDLFFIGRQCYEYGYTSSYYRKTVLLICLIILSLQGDSGLKMNMVMNQI